MLNSYNYLVKGVLYVCVSCNPKLFIILSEKKTHKRNVYKLVCILKSLVPPPPPKKNLLQQQQSYMLRLVQII